MPSDDTCCLCSCGPCVTCAPPRDTKKPPKQRGRHEMTTEQRATCGLAETAKGSAAGGCRGVGRAEAFARSLHHKLRSLGGAPASTTTTSTSISSASSNGAAGPDSSDDMEDSWSSAPSGPSSLTALRTLSTSSVDSASDMFYDLELVPQSPEEEVTSQELALMMAGSANRDDLLSNGNGPQSPQSDCSSDYFDTDCYEEERRAPPAVTQQSPLDGDATPSNGLAPPLVNGHGLANGSANGNTNGPASGATNGPVNGVANGPAKPKRPWNRVPHRFKAGTPEAMCEVSQRDLDDPDDDDEAAKPCSRKTGLAKLSFPKSSQTLLQEGLIEQLKQGHDIPVELKNGPCPGGTAAEDSCGPPVASSRGLTAMKEKARALDALATPEDETNGLLSDQDTLRLEATDAVINVVVDKDATPTKEADSAANKCRACGRQRVLDECPDCAADDRGDLSDGSKADRDDGSRPRVRRCSSLKTGKTPPGTPGRKKIVRFADVLGLDLADVRTFLDEIPKVPTSAYSDLQDVDQSDTLAVAGGCLPSGLPSGLPQLALAFNAVPSTDLPPFGARPVTRVLVPLFQQPGGQADFLDRVRDRQVCLENAVVADVALLSIAGQVRVRNLDFHKTVHLRYTTDGWRSFADLQASYVPNSCDGFSDKFTFTLFAGHTMSVGQRLEIAVRFQCKGQQYWDNNAGANYCFQCLPPSGAAPLMPLPSLHALGSPSDDGWKYLF